jgi:hypothetical protein
VKLYGIAGRAAGGLVHSKQLFGSPEAALAAAPEWKRAAFEAGVAEGFFGVKVVEHEVDDAVVRALLEGSAGR